MLIRLAISVAILAGTVALPAGARPPVAAAWEIGPVIDGRNYSVNVPPRPAPHRLGIAIDLPLHGNVNYVTFRHGSLTGKRRIVMRYRLEAAPGVRIIPRKGGPQYPSILSLYFQRRGDTWSGRGPYEAYRWFSTFRTHMPVVPGEHELVARLDENWTAVRRSTARTNPQAYHAAIAEADRVGFVLGGGDGYGHGVYATGPARLIVTEFRVE